MPILLNYNEGGLWYKGSLHLNTQRTEYNRVNYFFCSVPIFYRACFQVRHNSEGWHLNVRRWSWWWPGRLSLRGPRK